MQSYLYNRGVTVVEVLIGTTIILVVLVGITSAITQIVQARGSINSDLKVLYLAESGHEYLRYLRDDDWSNIDGLTPDTYYYFDISTTSIAITTTPEVIAGEYTRRFHVRELYRDGSDDIVASTTGLGTVDPEGYEIWVDVGSSSGTTTLKGILTNLFAQ